MGRYQDALNAVQAGIKKGVTDKNTAQMALGFAYVGLKNYGAGRQGLSAPPTAMTRAGHQPPVVDLRPQPLTLLSESGKAAGSAALFI